MFDVVVKDAVVTAVKGVTVVRACTEHQRSPVEV
jgi:hypothetical protein